MLPIPHVLGKEKGKITNLEQVEMLKKRGNRKENRKKMGKCSQLAYCA